MHTNINCVHNRAINGSNSESYNYYSTKIDHINDIIEGFNLPKSTKSSSPSVYELREEILKTKNLTWCANLIAASIKYRKILIKILLQGLIKNNVIDSLVGTKTFIIHNNETMSSIRERWKKTSVADSDILKSIPQNSFNLMKVCQKA